MLRRTPRCLLAFVAVSAVITLSLVACGGKSAESDGDSTGANGDSQGDSQSNAQGSGSDSGVLSTSCPASPPQTGSACSVAGTSCEYGGEGPYLACSTMFRCGQDGLWLSNASGGECNGSEAGNEEACPATFGALASGEVCPGVHTSCVYPEGVCQCTGCMPSDAGAQGVDGPRWSCVAWPETNVGCPTPRPRAGSACTTEGQKCDYSMVCRSVNLGLPNLECVGGVWKSQDVPQPPCVAPTCGQ